MPKFSKLVLLLILKFLQVNHDQPSTSLQCRWCAWLKGQLPNRQWANHQCLQDLVHKNCRRPRGKVLYWLLWVRARAPKKSKKPSLLSTANLIRSPYFLVHITIMILWAIAAPAITIPQAHLLGRPMAKLITCLCNCTVLHLLTCVPIWRPSFFQCFAVVDHKGCHFRMHRTSQYPLHGRSDLLLQKLRPSNCNRQHH